MIAYDNCYLYEFGASLFMRWDATVTKMVNEGVISKTIGCNDYKKYK